MTNLFSLLSDNRTFLLIIHQSKLFHPIYPNFRACNSYQK